MLYINVIIGIVWHFLKDIQYYIGVWMRLVLEIVIVSIRESPKSSVETDDDLII